MAQSPAALNNKYQSKKTPTVVGAAQCWRSGMDCTGAFNAIGSAIGTHAGPGCIAIAYFDKLD